MWSQCGLDIHPSLKEWHRCHQEDPQRGYLKSTIAVRIRLRCNITIYICARNFKQLLCVFEWIFYRTICHYGPKRRVSFPALNVGTATARQGVGVVCINSDMSITSVHCFTFVYVSIAICSIAIVEDGNSIEHHADLA